MEDERGSEIDDEEARRKGRRGEERKKRRRRRSRCLAGRRKLMSNVVRLMDAITDAVECSYRYLFSIVLPPTTIC